MFNVIVYGCNGTDYRTTNKIMECKQSELSEFLGRVDSVSVDVSFDRWIGSIAFNNKVTTVGVKLGQHLVNSNRSFGGQFLRCNATNVQLCSGYLKSGITPFLTIKNIYKR